MIPILNRIVVASFVIALLDAISAHGALPARSANAYIYNTSLTTSYRRGDLCHGSPAKCRGFSCAGSPSIISDIVPGNQPGAKSAQILDINVIYERTRQAGWLYKLSNGLTYIQFSYTGPAASRAFETEFETHGYDRRAVAAGNRYSGFFIWNEALPTGIVARKCVDGGELLG